MLNLKILILVTNNATKFLKILPDKFKFCMKKTDTEYKQKVSEFSLPYDGSTLKKMRETWSAQWKRKI